MASCKVYDIKSDPPSAKYRAPSSGICETSHCIGMLLVDPSKNILYGFLNMLEKISTGFWVLETWLRTSCSFGAAIGPFPKPTILGMPLQT